MTFAFDRYINAEIRLRLCGAVSYTDQQMFKLGIGIAGSWAARPA
jgi:hypothetical protein